MEQVQKRHLQVWNQLAIAFGGTSQVSYQTLGMAIAGQINNGGLEFGKTELYEVVRQICDEFEEVNIDFFETRRKIIAGMKEQARSWPGDNPVWVIVRELEQNPN